MILIISNCTRESLKLGNNQETFYIVEYSQSFITPFMSAIIFLILFQVQLGWAVQIATSMQQ